jgi:HD-GYP domain-containing protein (c-di-GMP phosphodiesterase class II)
MAALCPCCRREQEHNQRRNEHEATHVTIIAPFATLDHQRSRSAAIPPAVRQHFHPSAGSQTAQQEDRVAGLDGFGYPLLRVRKKLHRHALTDYVRYFGNPKPFATGLFCRWFKLQYTGIRISWPLCLRSRRGQTAPLRLPLPARIPILYVILSVLVGISVVPMYFYSAQVEAINRDRLKTNERLLQNTVTRSLADDIAQHEDSLRMALTNLASSVQVASGGDISTNNLSAPELRALLENFVSSSDDIAYATVLNSEAKGISAGRIAPDAFLQRELERAYSAATEGRVYNGQALTVGSGKNARTVMLVSTPIMYGGRFLGMIGSIVDLQFLIKRLQEVNRGGLTPYVVDSQGRLVAGASPDYATGQDMAKLEIVKNFVDEGGKAQLAATKEFKISDGKHTIDMLGTYSPVTALDWAVVAQKPRSEAYAGVFEMQRTARLLALLAVLLSIGLSIYVARKITNPLETLTESSRAIARGDFSQRVHLKSRTEIGELADTFNVMSQELEQFVLDLKRAAEENRALFMGSIQMLAGAVDEKDPYTKGHSDRVTRYSILIAKEMDLPQSFIETVRISALLHDVGKIGIEDRILKKPGALTPEEFEIMKTHTTKGANILRPVKQLREMLPGIELHHEALDGRGYPYGLKEDQIPLLARIIAVADTFDAVTTNRPYQTAHDPLEALRIINSLIGKRLDAKCVAALTAVFERGEIRIQRIAKTQAASAAAGNPPAQVTPPAASDAIAAIDNSRV